MESNVPLQSTEDNTPTTVEIMQTLKALQEQVLRMQERHDEALRGLGHNAATRPPSVPMSDALMRDEEATNSKRVSNGPKPAQPTEFDGDRTKGRAFLNSVKWYMRSKGVEFRDDGHRIAWTLSYMKSGRALTYANQVTRHTEVEGVLPYASWTEFWKELEDRFLPLDESEEAMNLLETDKYFQGRRTVDDYCDQFQDLIDHAEYTDGKQIVMKFRKGLEGTIADAVATLKEGRPADNDPNAWMKAAKDIARQRIRNEAFNTSIRRDRGLGKTFAAPVLRPLFNTRTTFPTIKENSFPTTNKTPLFLQTRSQPSSEAAVVTPKPKVDGPVPMEVDASRQRGRMPVVCHRCGQTGHFRNQCPRRFDVRYMSSVELEDHLQDQLAFEDAAEAIGKEPAEEESAEGDSKEDTKEDFQSGDE
jgi:hypothetical protein